MIAGVTPTWQDYAEGMPNRAWRDLLVWREAELERNKPRSS